MEKEDVLPLTLGSPELLLGEGFVAHDPSFWMEYSLIEILNLRLRAVSFETGEQQERHRKMADLSFIRTLRDTSEDFAPKHPLYLWEEMVPKYKAGVTGIWQLKKEVKFLGNSKILPGR